MVYRKIEIGETTRAEDNESFTLFMQNPGSLELVVFELYDKQIIQGKPARRKEDIVTYLRYPDTYDVLVKADLIVEANGLLYLTSKGLRVGKKHLYVPKEA